ncbi:MAG: hypothetical protein ACI4WS_04375 [Oscillospiraceae bacterium]
MTRQPFYILLLKGIGYIALGNVLCMFMTMALTIFSVQTGAELIFNIIAMICGTLIFYMLVFTVAWKDGTRERNLVKLHRVDGPLKYRWVVLGLILYVIAAAPTLLLLLNKLFFPESDTLYFYRFLSGSAYPFIQTFIPHPDLDTVAWAPTSYRQIDEMSVLFPSLMLVYYALIPAATQLGWYLGYYDKLSTEKIVYK